MTASTILVGSLRRSGSLMACSGLWQLLIVLSLHFAAAADHPQQVTPKSTETGAVVAGTCVDENGQPLSGVRVTLYLVNRQNERQIRLQELETDEEGAFRFTNLPDQTQRGGHMDDRYAVAAQKAGQATVMRILKQSNRSLELRMRKSATIRGTVTDPEGKPLEGAVARFEDWLPMPLDGLLNARTDVRGHFELTDVAPYGTENDFAPAAPLFFRVEHPDFAPTNVGYNAIPTRVEVVMEPAAIITGRVFYKSTGERASGVRVTCRSTDFQDAHWNWAASHTNEEGHYRLGPLPAGKFNIWAEMPGWTIEAIDSFAIESGEERQAPDLQFIRGGYVAGQLLNALTREPVTLEGDQTTRIGVRGGAGIVEQDGSFVIRAAPGENNVSITEAGPWQIVGSRSHTVTVVEGETTGVEFFVMPRRSAREEAEDVRQLRAWELQWQQEKPAIAAIRELGGWVETEPRGPYETVVEVNMVYHETEQNERLDNSQTTDEALFYVPKFTNLQRLLLKDAQATDEALTHIRGMEHLERIYMWDARLVTDDGVRHLATLPKLKYIHLSNSRISDKGLAHLRDAPHLWTRLEGLSLQGNTFSDDALMHLSVFVNLKSLHLGRGNNGITDEGLESITALQSLEVLDLQRSLVTDEGLAHLAKLPFVKEVWLSGTKVTDAGVAKLREALPDVLVRP